MGASSSRFTRAATQIKSSRPWGAPTGCWTRLAFATGYNQMLFQKG